MLTMPCHSVENTDYTQFIHICSITGTIFGPKLFAENLQATKTATAPCPDAGHPQLATSLGTGPNNVPIIEQCFVN